MKLRVFESFIFFWIISALPATNSVAENGTPVYVTLKPPAGTMEIGETPDFIGRVANVGKTPLHGLIIYLSLVSLEPGKEQPVDLEDWSAEKAVRIDRLLPGETKSHAWSIRLIQAGKFGVALTVVDPGEQKPIVSPLVQFEIQRKLLFESKWILSVAIGEPLLLLMVWLAINSSGGGIKFSRRTVSA
jgi:hypothetical protein